MDLKILYDYQIFAYQKYGGISRYFVEQLKVLNFYYSIATKLIVYNNKNYYLDNMNKDFYDIKTKNNLIYNSISKYCHKDINELNSLINIYRKHSYDVFHPTYYNPYFINTINKIKKPYVLTVHDMIHELFDEQNVVGDKTKDWKRDTIGEAKRIIAVSENTKKDILKFYDIDPKIIDVVYHGVTSLGDCVLTDSEYKRFKNTVLDKEYILYVGNRSGYKNFGELIKAFSVIVKSYPNLYLVCVGGGKFTNKEKTLISLHGIDKNILNIWCVDTVLDQIYKNAICLVCLSLYEGFGLPIIEAFSKKCPVILSNKSCHPEIAQDGGIYFEPSENGDDLVDKLDMLLNDIDKTNGYINKGYIRSKHFTWIESATKTKEVYEKCLE